MPTSNLKNRKFSRKIGLDFNYRIVRETIYHCKEIEVKQIFVSARSS